METLTTSPSSYSSVEGTQISSIGRGIVALCGLHEDDNEEALRYCSKKLVAAKLWENEAGKPWRTSVSNLEGGEVLLVSQFTLYGTVAGKKHTPDFKRSMKSERASEMYEAFKEMVVAGMGEGGAGRVKDGMFGAMMDVALVNDGPVTILVDSPSSDCAGGDSARDGVREEK